jgi:hypothetical protein
VKKFASVFLIWMIAVCIPVFRIWQVEGYSSWDLGIYAQAFYGVSQGNWNPWISVRQLFLFADHFDPVILLVGQWARWIEPALLGVAVDLLSTLLGAITAVYFGRKWGIKNGVAIFALLLFSRAQLQAVAFPAHASTWAIPVWVYLVLAWANDNRVGAFWSTQVLCLFREEYLFVWPMEACSEFWNRRWKTGFVFLVSGALWMTAVFWVRPRLLGSVMNYGGDAFLPLLMEPDQALWRAWVNRAFWNETLKIFLPWMPIWMWGYRFVRWSTWLWIFIPGILIRFLTSKMGFHYGGPVLALAFAISLPILKESVPRKVWAASVALGLSSILSFLTYVTVPAYLGRYKQMPSDSVRLSELGKATEILGEMRRDPFLKELPLLTQNHLIPRRVHCWNRIDLLGMHPPDRESSGFLLLFEKKTGDCWPIDCDQRDSVINGFSEIWDFETWFDGQYVMGRRYFKKKQSPVK